METRRILFDLGRVMNAPIVIDFIAPIHLRIVATLDHEVDPSLLKQAWDRTKRVYPIIDSVVGSDQGKDYARYLDESFRKAHAEEHFYLVEPDEGTNDPVESAVPLAPGTPAVGGRLVCITYCGNQVAMTCYHALSDGRGIRDVFCTFLYLYLALYTGHEDEHPVVELREGRSLEDHYKAKTDELVYSLDYTPVPLYTLPLGCTGFFDEDMQIEEYAYEGNMAIDSADFLRLCKANGANPSAMMCALLARAAYSINPDENRDIVFELTVSQREMLGLTGAIGNAVGIAYAYATRAEVDERTLAEVCQKIRGDVTMQRGKDYMVSYERACKTYDFGKPLDTRVVTYVGTLSVGDNDSHIKDLWMATFSKKNLYLMELNGRFMLSLLYGHATQRYLDELLRILTELGVTAELTHPAHSLLSDTNDIVCPTKE